jgi:hypothetical protein
MSKPAISGDSRIGSPHWHPAPEEKSAVTISKSSPSEGAVGKAASKPVVSNINGKVGALSLQIPEEDAHADGFNPFPSEAPKQKSRSNLKAAGKRPPKNPSEPISRGEQPRRAASRIGGLASVPASSPPFGMRRKAFIKPSMPESKDPAVTGRARRIKVPESLNSGACPKGVSCRKNGKSEADGPCNGNAAKRPLQSNPASQAGFLRKSMKS